ncbi:hypothetical protein V1498_12730 [Peribacillus sp. SCS-26]|uniref:hypothetical protein n=1 Tax=Paraperibacillus marinus TaxID=3115295 RepID=UPI003905A785
MKLYNWGLLLLLTASLAWGIHYVTDDTHAQLFKGETIESVKLAEKWKEVKNEQDINKNAKIENFQMLLDKNSRIESVKFNIIEKRGDSFTIYRYREDQEVEHATISEIDAKRYDSFEKLTKAASLFKNLDALNKQHFFYDQGKHPYNLIVAGGEYENILVRGDYYILGKKPILQQNPGNKDMKGYWLQMIGNNKPQEFSSDSEGTKTVMMNN